MYTCGITPYDSAHLGHAAVYVTYDVLQRRLRDLGHKTLCVRNITDVDDDILRKARELNVHYLDLAAEEIVRFDADMKALGLLPAFSEPRATSAIPDILGFIGMVLDTGHAYRAGGAVYFDVSSFPPVRPGEPSRARRDDRARRRPRRSARRPVQGRPPGLRPLAALGAGTSPRGSRCGGRAGRDGTSSARRSRMRELGPTIDLHGGGSDLIFPHHECESAQSEAATGSRFVRHWMHVGMVRLGGEKMSKSLGNLVFVHRLREEGHDPAAIRLALLSQQYRTSWEWKAPMLEEAEDRLDRWRVAGPGDAALEAVRDRLDDDLDTPAAIEAHRRGGRCRSRRRRRRRAPRRGRLTCPGGHEGRRAGR